MALGINKGKWTWLVTMKVDMASNKVGTAVQVCANIEKHCAIDTVVTE